MEIFEITKVEDGSPVRIDFSVGDDCLSVAGAPEFVFGTLDEILENCAKFRAFVRNSLGDCTPEEFDASLDRQLVAAGFKPRAAKAARE